MKKIVSLLTLSAVALLHGCTSETVTSQDLQDSLLIEPQIGPALPEEITQSPLAVSVDPGETVDIEMLATGSVTLNWTAPVARIDGEALSMSEIDGYVIYYGTNSNNFLNTMVIDDSSTTSYTLSELPVGEEYFFTVATKDTDGLESTYSGIVSTLVQENL